MAIDTSVLERARGERQRALRDELLWGAIVGGVLSGVAMMAWLAGAAAFAGRPPLRPLELVAATFAEVGGAAPGPGALLAAALLWVATSAALALPFAATLPRDFPSGSAVLLGVAYSAVAMAFATSLVLPWVNPEMREGMSAMGGAWVLGFAVYGIGLGFVPWLRRRVLAR